MLQVKVMACQAERPEDPACTNGSRCRMQKDCSSWALAEAKTKPKPNADDLDMADYDNKLKIRTANETTGETYISWRPPRDPNEMIVKYTLEDATTLGKYCRLYSLLYTVLSIFLFSLFFFF